MDTPATSAAMGTAATATAVTTATVLSECWIWRESEAEENS
jgi:hypothetical protein